MRRAGTLALLLAGLFTVGVYPVQAGAPGCGDADNSRADCADAIDHTVTVNMTNLDSVCTAPLQLDYDWVDCHRIFDSND